MSKEKAEALQKQIDVICEETMDKAREAVQELPPKQKALSSLKVMQDQAANEVKKEIELTQKTLADGFSVIEGVLADQNKPGLEELKKWFAEHENDFIQHAKEEQEITLQRKLKLPFKHLGLMYQSAAYLYGREMYKEAVKAMAVCIALNPTIYDFWFLYGSILQKMKEHELSLVILQIAAGLEENNPYPIAYMAKSWVDLENWTEAAASLKEAKTLCNKSHEFDEVKEYCQSLSTFITKKQGG